MKKIIFIMLSSLISFIVAVSGGYDKENKNFYNDGIEEKSIINEVVENEVKQNEELIADDSNINEQEDEMKIEESNVENVESSIMKEVKIENKNSLSDSKINNNVIKDIPKQETTEIKKEEKTVEESKIDIKAKEEPKKVEQKKIEEQPQNTVQQKDVEEYKINQKMINQITNIINGNQTEDMKNFGYTIVVDKTIVESTSQFTFTEQRVKDKITWKFGTIKIYAQDYYNNGNYICTQCFII